MLMHCMPAAHCGGTARTRIHILFVFSVFREYLLQHFVWSVNACAKCWAKYIVSMPFFTRSRKNIRKPHHLHGFRMKHIFCTSQIFNVHNNEHIPYTLGNVSMVLVDDSGDDELKVSVNSQVVSTAMACYNDTISFSTNVVTYSSYKIVACLEGQITLKPHKVWYTSRNPHTYEVK